MLWKDNQIFCDVPLPKVEDGPPHRITSWCPHELPRVVERDGRSRRAIRARL